MDAFFSESFERRDKESQLLLARIDGLQDGAKLAPEKAEWLDKRYGKFQTEQANFDLDIAAASPEEAERLRLDQKANLFRYGAFIAGEYAENLGNHPDRIMHEKEAGEYDERATELGRTVAQQAQQQQPAEPTGQRDEVADFLAAERLDSQARKAALQELAKENGVSLTDEQGAALSHSRGGGITI